MAPSKRAGKSSLGGGVKNKTVKISAPFKPAPESLEPFYAKLSTKHVYIAHIDPRPRDLKRKVFLVPVLMNVVVALLFCWRTYHIAPYYLKLVQSALGYANDTTVRASDSTYRELAWIILSRCASFIIDFLLFVFVWPWPVEFCLGREYGSPLLWRWAVGFRDKEIYVRRSRNWDLQTGDYLVESSGRSLLLGNVRAATSPMLLEQKTGYLTINGDWDLDWAAMVHAHKLVDSKDVALNAFSTVVLVHHESHGWLCLETGVAPGAKEDERRKQVFRFRDALASIGKEDLFFRWIEIVQFEATQPEGFGPEKQAEVAKSIRELFQSNGVDFDEFWQQSVGSEGLAGMA